MLGLGSRKFARAARIALVTATMLTAMPAIAADTAPAANAPTEVRYGTWGVDLKSRDLSVKPGDDFQR